MTDYLQLQTIITSMGARLELSDALLSAAADGLKKYPKLVSQFYQKGVNKKSLFSAPYAKLQKKYGASAALAVTLALAEKALRRYNALGISDAVFNGTMSDIKLWAHNFFVTDGERGLGELGWIYNHLDLNLFRIGRLQYQFFKLNNPLFFTALKCKPGANALFVHIPQGEPLTIEGVKASFRAANAFFKTFYPDFHYKYYVTETWLLYADNKCFMAEGSNILKFSALFTNVGNLNIQSEAEKRIFGKEYCPSDTETSLQRAAKAYQKGGGKLGIGLGYVAKENFDDC